MQDSDVIIDQEAPPIIPARYLKKSLMLLRIYVVEFLLFVLFAIARSFLGAGPTDILAGIVGLGIMVTLAISPLGLFFSFKAFREKEKTSSVRLWHLIGHLFVFIILASMMALYIASKN